MSEFCDKRQWRWDKFCFCFVAVDWRVLFVAQTFSGLNQQSFNLTCMEIMAQILYRGNCEMNLYAYVKMCSCFIVYIIVRQKIGTVALSLCVCLIRRTARFLDYVCVFYLSMLAALKVSRICLNLCNSLQPVRLFYKVWLKAISRFFFSQLNKDVLCKEKAVQSLPFAMCHLSTFVCMT